jgi:hypothetical protein
MFIYFVQNSQLTDNNGYRERFHRAYNEYKDAKEYIANYLKENDITKVNLESEDKFNEEYYISYSFDVFNVTIKQRFIITRERLY